MSQFNDWIWVAAFIGVLHFGVTALWRLSKIVDLLSDIQFKLGWICDSMKQRGQGYDPLKD